MTEEEVKESITEAIPVETVEEEIDYVDVVQTNGQMNLKIFHFLVGTERTRVTVIAPDSYMARAALNQHHPNAVIAFGGTSEQLIQVQ